MIIHSAAIYYNCPFMYAYVITKDNYSRLPH